MHVCVSECVCACVRARVCVSGCVGLCGDEPQRNDRFLCADRNWFRLDGPHGACHYTAPSSLLRPAGYPRTFMYGSMIPSLVLIIALHFMKNSHPWNVVLLGLFTVCESLMIGVLAAAYKTAGMTDVLLSAAGLTLGIFLCLTAFVFISKKDFSFMGGFLFAGLFIMIGWGLLNLIFGWRVCGLSVVQEERARRWGRRGKMGTSRAAMWSSSCHLDTKADLLGLLGLSHIGLRAVCHR